MDETKAPLSGSTCWLYYCCQHPHPDASVVYIIKLSTSPPWLHTKSHHNFPVLHIICNNKPVLLLLLLCWQIIAVGILSTLNLHRNCLLNPWSCVAASCKHLQWMELKRWENWKFNKITQGESFCTLSFHLHTWIESPLNF